MHVRARAWRRSHSFHHSSFPAAKLAAERQATVSVCLPARNEERTIGSILDHLLALRRQRVIDQVVVLDDSSDRTGEIARRQGAEVHDQHQLMPELGPVLGKGDAMWRGLSVLTGDIVCYLDADSEQFGPHYVCGLLGPLLEQPSISFVKGFYRRPLRVGTTTLPDGGGRVTELTARPLLAMFYPELTGFGQPLAGELAARRGLLERLPFVTGYGVDIALLLDAYAEVGLESLAQVDLDVRQNAHQPLRDLSPMASDVLQAVVSRLAHDGTVRSDTVESAIERPPIQSLRIAA